MVVCRRTAVAAVAMSIVTTGIITPDRAAANASGPDPSVAVAFDKPEYTIGDAIKVTITVQNRGGEPATGVQLSYSSSKVTGATADWGEFRQTTIRAAVLDRDLLAGESLTVTVRGTATGYQVVPTFVLLSASVRAQVDAVPGNNYLEDGASLNSNGYSATVGGTIFADVNRNGARDSGEVVVTELSPGFWKAGIGVSLPVVQGTYSFKGLIGEDYDIRVGPLEDDWIPTTPARRTFTLTAAGAVVDFGVVPVRAAPPPVPAPAPVPPPSSGGGSVGPGRDEERAPGRPRDRYDDEAVPVTPGPVVPPVATGEATTPGSTSTGTDVPFTERPVVADPPSPRPVPAGWAILAAATLLVGLAVGWVLVRRRLSRQ